MPLSATFTQRSMPRFRRGMASNSSAKSFSNLLFNVPADAKRKQFAHGWHPIQVQNSFHQSFRVLHLINRFFAAV